MAASAGAVEQAERPTRSERGGALSGSARQRLAAAVLSYLPLSVAVIDADQRLLFWNDQAAGLVGTLQSGKTAGTPLLPEILSHVADMTPQQREGLIDFVAAQVRLGDKAESSSCLRITLGRGRRIVLQVRGIGAGRWMLIIDDGSLRVVGEPGEPAQHDGMAWLDALTGLGNRRHFERVLRNLVDGPSRGVGHSVVLIDLDGFTAINDKLGHSLGDALLCLAARRLRRETREEDLLVRWGDDEFAVLTGSDGRADILAARVVTILARPFLVEGVMAHVGASVGVARLPDRQTSADDLMHNAMLALQAARFAGGGTWRLFDPAMAAEQLSILEARPGAPKETDQLDREQQPS